MIRPVRADGRIDAGGVFTPIYRPRVVDRIAAAAEQRVVLIVAPAGYGKSTALRQYLDGVTTPVVRYDLHADNGTLLGFLRGFSEALTEIAPDARKTLVTAYDSARDSTTAGAELAMWLHAHIKTFGGTIVIDDLHIAEGERQVSAFLASLVERTKGRVRWIIASRSFLDLPVGSWLAYQEMDLAIDETDLAFTAEEARSTARASRVGVRDEELEALVDLTGGWPTALAFALRTSIRSLDLRNVQAVTREMVYKYLAEQVYNALDDADRELLATCALLPEIEIAILEAIGYDDAFGTIEALRHRVAFIVPHVEKKRVYRMHDLFRDFIMHEMELSGAAIVAERRCVIAAVLIRREEYPEALSAFVAAGAWDEVEALLDQFGLLLFDGGHGDAIGFAVSAIRTAGRPEHAVSMALRGMIEIGAGRYEEGEKLLNRAIARSEDPGLRAVLLLRVGRNILNRGGDSSAALMELMRDADLSMDIRGEAASLLAIHFARIAHDVERQRAVDFALDASDTTDDRSVRARILQRVALSLVEIGDHGRALQYLLTAGDLAQAEGQLTLAGRAYQAIANVMSSVYNDRAKHLWYAQQAHQAAVKSGDRPDMQLATLQLLGAEARRGNVERVLALERQLGDLRTSDPRKLEYAAVSRALRRSWEGGFAEAYRLLADLWHKLGPVANQVMAGSQCAIFAAADGRVAESGRIVAEVLKYEAAASPTALSFFGRAIPLLFCALAEGLAGRHTAAARILKGVDTKGDPQIDCFAIAVTRCLKMAKSHALDADSLTEELEPLRTFGYGGYAILMESAISRVLKEGAGAANVSMTRAEVAVLRSLANGSTPKEIAHETGRSVYTVQAHIQNVMEKLGCHGRHEAVVAAQRLGVI